MTSHKPATLSTSEAAAALDVDRKTILNWIDAGKITAESEQYSSRTYYRIPLSEIARLRAAKPEPAYKKTGKQ